MTTSHFRTACFFEAMGMALPVAELNLLRDVGADVPETFVESLRTVRGRVARTEVVDDLVHHMEERDAVQPRKRRRAKRVAQFLSLVPGIRFVALANTTAFGAARDGGDLDFFIVVRHGMIWTARLLSVLPLRLFRLTPRPHEERDAVCLSYFISDQDLCLTSHQLSSDDPYFRYWFLSLVPLVDDGVGAKLWEANAPLRARHPFALRWETAPEYQIRSRSWIRPMRWFEHLAERIQRRRFPESIRGQINHGTAVMVSDTVLKFHVDDGRERYRHAYTSLCQSHECSP